MRVAGNIFGVENTGKSGKYVGNLSETQEKCAHAVVRSVGECLPAEKRACGAPGEVHATPAAETPERWVEMPKRLPVRVNLTTYR